MTGIREADWPVLVTGASGFVGGHIARGLARAGHPVRALYRREPRIDPGDPPIEWMEGDLRNPLDRHRALIGVRGVIHSASWVSLGSDPGSVGQEVNVDATRGLIEDSVASGVERLVYTSTLHTLATGTPDSPADEGTSWNLESVRSPYERTKREAESWVLDGLGGRLSTIALCPGMVIGPRDPKPTSTSVLLVMARSPIAFLPGGGIPVLDASVAALAHRRALWLGEPGRRYALVGPYLSYAEIARLVGRIVGQPHAVLTIPDLVQWPIVRLAGGFDRLTGGRRIEVSRAAIAGGFLRLHVRGDLADSTFGLHHPPPIESICRALADAKRSGLAPWLKIRSTFGDDAQEPGGPSTEESETQFPPRALDR
ncbi:NAD-dependent epimerase/dehydratase family protein [Tundrisphaera lichenicola]|uniref:NAD-dependent epimerase/dehydratase family protein n=1 Tax=Tundrisphaera lichenicola TaxID=2029860 RepID=UPI003EB92CD2